MPNAFVSGYAGSVTMPATHGGTNAALKTWRGVFMQDTKEIGVFGARPKAFRGGRTEGNGSIGGFAQSGAAGAAPGAVSMSVTGDALTLTIFTGCTYTGTAIFKQVSLGADVSDPASEVGWDFNWTGTIAEAWA